MDIKPFHLAMPVNDLQSTREFYGKTLGLSEGRSNEHWIDWNFFGHQFVTHLNQNHQAQKIVNQVDDHGVPVPHFGIVLKWDEWHEFAERLKQNSIKFVIEPYIRFRGKTGEQATMFFYDPSGNALEFKAFKDISQLFVK
ncbi:MAG: glyoxalase [Alphaproteobacteria bacterium]|nr:glyoxalase [Alphaproteobacteria bacterium]